MKHLSLVIFISYFLIGFINKTEAQNYNRIFKQIENGRRLESNLGRLERIYMRDPGSVLPNYGLALYYKRLNNSDDLFLSWFHIQKAYHSAIDIKSGAEKRKLTEVLRNPAIISTKYMEIDSLLWESLKNFTDLEKMQSMLAGLEKSKYLPEYIELRNSLEYLNAVDKNSLGAYRRFIDLFPSAKEINDVIKRRDTLEFKIAKEKDIIFVYNDFISKHPESLLLEQARLLRDEKAFGFIQNSQNIEELDFFIHNYPNAPDLNEAILIRENLAYQIALTNNSISTFQDFIHRYPQSRHMDDAVSKRDLLVFAEIQKTSDNESFKMFLSGFPFASQALKTFIESYYISRISNVNNSPLYNYQR